MHDLEIVAILDRHIGKRRSRHDLQVALDRDAMGIEPELAEQIGNADAGDHPPVLVALRALPAAIFAIWSATRCH